ncbi:mechanosensitive ion channel family protein [Aerococcus mictus]|uniref:mechanosensitive ion channel domain-containing protein n=1 Tax=Aerococcus mictus TaxID=2976810 RepID=UPI000DCEA618|nr:mechanosensitive ion channel family protein [Aerococcus mictus]
MHQFLDYLNSDQSDSDLFVKNVLISLGLILIGFLFMKALGWFLPRLFKRDSTAQAFIRVTRLILILLISFFILSIWFTRVEFFGVMIIIVVGFAALASKDIIVDLVAYIYIYVRSPLRIGSAIDINGVSGEVVDFDFLQINLAEIGKLTEKRSYTGRYVSVPNRWIFDHAVYNYNHDSPFVVVDVMVPVDFKEDTEEVMKITARVAYEQYSKFMDKCDDESLEIFERKMESLGADKKPKIRIEVGNSAYKVFVEFFTNYDAIGQNKMLMQNALYQTFMNKGIEVPIIPVVKVEN